MNFAITADIHINSSQYDDSPYSLNWRTKDFESAFDNLADDVISKKESHKLTDLFILGDIFDHPAPGNNSRKAFARIIRKISEVGINVHILIGNHDANSQGHPLMSMKELKVPNVFIYFGEGSALERDNILFLMLPQTLSIENKNKTVRQELHDFSEEHRKTALKARKEGKDVVFCGHFGVMGAFMNDGAKNTSSSSVTLNDLNAIGANYVFLGDYHGHQKLDTDKDVLAMYCGSLERTNIADVKSEKGYLIFSSDKKDKVEFVSLNDKVRPMFDIVGGIDIVEKAEALGDKVKGAIIRLHYIGTKDSLNHDDPEIMELKKSLEKKGAQHVYKKNSCTNPEQEKRAKDIMEEMSRMEELGKEAIGEKDVLRICEINIDKQDFDDEEKQLVLELCESVVGAVEKENRID